MKSNNGFIGYACANTPLPLIHAAGFAPYRVLPNVECPDQSGRLMHDNLCPHVKRVLDRAMNGSLPPLEGMVFMNSCDSMRRLFDAWKAVLPGMNAALIDLPVTADPVSSRYFRDEIGRLRELLARWSGRTIDDAAVAAGISLHNGIARSFAGLRARVAAGTLPEGAAALQEAYNFASMTAPGETMEYLEKLAARPADDAAGPAGVPVYLFGNVIPEPEIFGLFESCGARIIQEDSCTGSRLFSSIDAGGEEDVMLGLAAGILRRPPCARTFDAAHPGSLGAAVIAGARKAGARGVIGYTVKFCDPYIARIPDIRASLRREGIPFLQLEGDCTLRSIGQQRTRIEAFTEMMR